MDRLRPCTGICMAMHGVDYLSVRVDMSAIICERFWRALCACCKYWLRALVPTLFSEFTMPGYVFDNSLFKDQEALNRFCCPSCKQLLCNPVQLSCCGHRICKSCADEILRCDSPSHCPQKDCGEEFATGTSVSHQYSNFVQVKVAAQSSAELPQLEKRFSHCDVASSLSETKC